MHLGVVDRRVAGQKAQFVAFQCLEIEIWQFFVSTMTKTMTNQLLYPLHITVMSWLSAHRSLNITHDFSLHELTQDINLYRNCYIQ